MENTKDYINPWAYDYSGDDGTGMINPPAFPGGGVDEQEMNDAIQTAVDKLVNGAPAALDTLGEIAEALENDESIEARLVAEIAKKLDTDTYEADKATFATKDEIPTVPTKVSELDNDANFITEDALSDYAKSADVYTKDEADTKFLTEHQDISNLATKEEVSEVEGKIPTKVSELENDANYLTEHQSLEEYAKIEDVYTKEQADAKFLTEHQSLEDYATKEELELKANSDDLAAVATSGSYNDLEDKPEIPVIPENVSAFTNDAGYLTEHQDLSTYVNGATYNSDAKEIDFKHDDNVLFVIDATPFIKDGMISSVAIDNGNLVITFNTDAGKEPITIPLTEIFNPANYYTKAESDELFATKAEIPTKVSELENDANYLTEHQSLEDYAKKEDLATVATTGSYNDLEDKPEIPEVPENVSAFTNDAGYLTEHQSLEGYATETWVNEQGFLKEHQDLSAYVTGGDYNSQTKAIELKNGDTVLASIDATDFIKDGMVSEVKIEGGNLVITFNSDSGKEDIAIPLTDIFNPENYYTKTETNNKFVVGKITNQNGSYALIFNESDGGGSQYFNSTANVISYVGTNDGDANGICVQIYSKNKATNEGTRINVNPNGAYYGVGASTPLDPYNEIAVKGNISDLNTQIGNELAEKDATIASLKSEVYSLKQIVGDMGGAVTYDLPGEGKSFNALMSNNGTVKLSEDVETGRFGPGMMAKNDVTLNLNGHTLEVDTTGDYASILARGSQTVTIKGSGANSKIVNNGNGKILWVASTSATANIQSGNFIGNGDAPELIYCENGTINITGGTFRNSNEDKRYLLNCKDANFQAGTANIIVSSTSKTSGPKFYDFDPSNNPEGEGTTYVAEGCHVISSVVTEDGVEYTVYTVVKDA